MVESCGSKSFLQMNKDLWGDEKEGLKAEIACGVHTEICNEVRVVWGTMAGLLQWSKTFA